ncbi:hypothetical protein H2199_003877 [Coniosporium tulheliwenetii]|uniref:Uncharacterized protein n=1 Tax=Coniosporium tulheliwenetii TaxID=3383036 RepID=A0ACC2Z8N1_9PEZI|nr:hypothetical protein H2199_003877 [Cladosporium sp. JES 115]
MSLFGGEAVPTPNEDPASPSPSSHSGFSIDDPAQHAQPRPAVSVSSSPEPVHTAVDVNDINVAPEAGHTSPEPEEEEEEEDEEDEDRPNKYHGAARTWRHWTAPERQLIASLNSLQAEDLSLHLYNAHALKRRLRPQKPDAGKPQPWQSKDSWIDELKKKEWIPPSSWTAWPLQPERVPRPEERFVGPWDDGLEDWTVGGRVKESDEEVREILVGLVQRRAKERWWGRGWEGDGEGDVEEVGEETARSGSRSRGRSRRRVKLGEASRSRAGRGSSAGRSSGGTSRAASEVSDATDVTNEGHRGLARPDGAEDTEDRSSIPTILADDDEASHILEPTITALMGKLDALLDGLRHSRNGHIRRDTDDEGTSRSRSQSRSRPKPRRKPPKPPVQTPTNPQDQATEEQHPEPPAQPRRKVGRPRKPFQQPIAPDPAGDSHPSPPRKGARGRPRKWPKPLPGETHYMMRRRVTAGADFQPDDLPPSAPEPTGQDISANSPSQPASDTDSDHSASTRSTRGLSRRRRHPSRSNSRSSRRGPAPRDWSEVLGVAALVGWDPGIVARAAQRLDADGALKGVGKVVEVVPRPRTNGDDGEDDEEGAEGEAEGEEQRRPYLHPLSLNCPHEDCERHHREFPQRFRLTEHIMRKHGYDPRKERYGEEGDDEGEGLVGGAHNDGFLELVPLTAGRGKRGKGEEKNERAMTGAARKKRKVNRAREGDGEGAGAGVEDGVRNGDGEGG